MNRLISWVGCDEAASVRIEVYSAARGLMHGSLDASVYACDEHAQDATDAIHAAGLTAYRSGAPLHKGDRGCGHEFRYPTTTGGDQ